MMSADTASSPCGHNTGASAGRGHGAEQAGTVSAWEAFLRKVCVGALERCSQPAERTTRPLWASHCVGLGRG